MNKVFDDKIQASIFIKNHFKNHKNFKENKLIFFFRILNVIFDNINTIPKYTYIDIIKFNEEFIKLSDTYKSVLSIRYGEKDDACHTFLDIGNKLYISQARVSEINREAIKKLKRHINNYYFNSCDLNNTIKYETSIKSLNLTPRVQNLLIRSHIDSIEKLIKLSKDDLLLIYGIGETTYNEIIQKLEEYKKNKA